MKSKKSFGSIVVTLLAAGVVWFLQEKGFLANEGGGSSRGADFDVSVGEVAVGDFTTVQTNGSGWTHLQDCRFITGRNSDGDSFHVKHEQGETEFRLYFVDTPESQYKSYRDGNNNGERIAEQGDYFGGLSQKETTSVGTSGKNFVKKILAQNKFQVLTKWENVYGPDRKYCLVVVPWEGRQVYLHELLVAGGLARIHTRGADLPKGRDYRAQKSFLQAMEKSVRDKKVGAWGL